MKTGPWAARIALLLAVLIWGTGCGLSANQASLLARAHAAAGEQALPRAAPFRLYSGPLAHELHQGHGPPAVTAQSTPTPLFLPMVARPGGDPADDGWIDPVEGGTVTSGDGSLTVTIPPGALSRRTEVEITATRSTPVSTTSSPTAGAFTTTTARAWRFRPARYR